MKRATVAVVFAALAGIGVSAQSPSDAREDVVAAQKRFYEAYRTCNAQELERMVTDDLLYVYSVGMTHQSKAEFLKTITPGCGWDELAVDPQTVRVHGDTAWVLGQFRYKGRNKPAITAKLLAMQVFVKRDGRWLLASNQTTEAIPLGASVTITPPQPKP